MELTLEKCFSPHKTIYQVAQSSQLQSDNCINFDGKQSGGMEFETYLGDIENQILELLKQANYEIEENNFRCWFNKTLKSIYTDLKSLYNPKKKEKRKKNNNLY